MLNFVWERGSQGDINSLEFFLEQVRREREEHMTFQLDNESTSGEKECLPSVQQTPMHRVEEHTRQDVLALQDMEIILQGRLQAYKNFADTIKQTVSSVAGRSDDTYYNYAPSTGSAMNRLYMYYEKEMHLAMMEEELQRSKKLVEIQRGRAQRLQREYSKAMQVAESDLVKCEKKLEKALREKTRSAEEWAVLCKDDNTRSEGTDSGGSGALLDGEMRDGLPSPQSSRELAFTEKSASPIGSDLGDGAANGTEGQGQSRRRSSGGATAAKLKSAFAGMTSRLTKSVRGSSIGSFEDGAGSSPSSKELDRRRRASEALDKADKDAKDSLASLKVCLADRDDLQVATNYAHQNLCNQNKLTLKEALGHMIDLEERCIASQQKVLNNMKATHAAIDVGADEQAFIRHNCGDQRGPVLLSKALSILDDLTSTGKAQSAEALLGQYASISLDHLESGDGDHLPGIHREMNKIFRFTDVSTGEDASPEAAVEKIRGDMDSKEGREIIVNALNQYRSRKVNVGAGFIALGKLLWYLLDSAFQDNDTRCARVVMMLSQTFHRNVEPKNDDGVENKDKEGNKKESIDDASALERRREREYVKTQVSGHQIWHASGCRFWEQALWQLVIEQLPTVRLEKPWYELDMQGKEEIACQIHDVVFSQVMAISHSMKEMNCDHNNIRSFIYRMTAVHQLSEFQRHLMIEHLNNPR